LDLFSNIYQQLFSIANISGIELARSIISLFVIIDPIGTVPLFAAITAKMDHKERKSVSKTAVVTAGALLLIFAIAGTQILSLLSISISSFMIAGGVLLFMVSIELLTHGAWRFGGTISDESGVVPLAFPLLAGPGAITSVILSFQSTGLAVTMISIVVVIGLTYIIYSLTNPIYRILGRRGSMIVTRVFAVLVAAIAVEYMVNGIKSVQMVLG
jgi:multiple antibiotic resistance protein